MQLKKFLIEIERLKPTAQELELRNLPLSEQDRWDIGVIQDEFNAYESIMYQLIYCIDTLKLFYGLEQLEGMIDGPMPYFFWGVNTNYNFYYCFNFFTDEILAFDDITSSEPVMYCAASQGKFLDCLIEVAKFERLRILSPDNVDNEREKAIDLATRAAGGEKYREHCAILIC